MAIEFDLFLAFFSGLIFGFSPCILLLLSTFGTSFLIVEEKSKFIKISIGLISGIVITYIIISFLIYLFVEFSSIFRYINFIFAGILIFLGIYQLVEAKKEKSRLFGTSEKVKTILKNFIEKNSGFYAFLIGIIFSLIKLPTCGSLLVVLILDLYSSPLLVLSVFIYILGMVLPIIIVLIFIRLGLESSKVDEFRKKYRTHLRIINGAVLIFLAIYLLILDDILRGTIS